MCLIIHKPKGMEIEQWILDSAKEYNSDGVGIMSNGNVERFMKIKTSKLYDKINLLDNAAIHFRYATHGTTDITNVHPFKLNGGIFLMHNGVMQSYAAPKGSSDSDTATFCKEYANPQIAINGKLNLKFFEAAIIGQRMALMHNYGRITRHGSSWSEYAGSYFSNDYMWDSPNNWKATKEYWKNNTATDYAEKFGGSYLEYQGVTDRVDNTPHSYRSTDDMIDDFLYDAIYQLPLENDDYVHGTDADLYNDIWSGKIDVETFVDECSPETKINLFSFLIEKGLL